MDDTVARRIHGATRLPKVCMVQNIEEFATKLEPGLLGQPNMPENRNVQIKSAGTTKNIPSGTAVSSRRGQHERIGIEPAFAAPHVTLPRITHLMSELGRNPVVGNVTRNAHPEWKAAPKLADGVDLPTSQQLSWKTPGKVPSALAER